jgi:hypothetical protein
MSDKTLSQRLRELKAAIQGGNFSAFATLDECITQAEAQEAQAPISWRDIKVTKGQETYPLGTLIELLEYERDTALASLKSQEAQVIGEQTPVVIKDSEVFTACETYADNYLIEGRITTSPKAMRMALKKFMEGRSPMSSDARDKAIEALVAALSAIRLSYGATRDKINQALSALRG